MPLKLREIFSSLVHLIYPELCIACNKRTRDILDAFCFDCYTELPFTHFTNLTDNEFKDHFKGKISISFGASLFYFIKTGVIQNIIKQLKYHNKDFYGIKLGILFGTTFLESDLSKSVSVIVPVPLHKRKQARRGYNQSRMIAEGIGSVFNVPVDCNNLIRVKNTMTQTKMDNEARIKNVHDAFSVLKPNEFQDKHVLLVDDVLTTGSTLLECANTLKDIAGISISMATIAIGETV